MKAIATILLVLLVLGGCSSGYDSVDECLLEETKKCKSDNCITYIEEMCLYPLNNPKYFSSDYIKELEAEERQREEARLYTEEWEAGGEEREKAERREKKRLCEELDTEYQNNPNNFLPHLVKSMKEAYYGCRELREKEAEQREKEAERREKEAERREEVKRLCEELEAEYQNNPNNFISHIKLMMKRAYSEKSIALGCDVKESKD